jgi:hypothetical protein
MGKHYSNRPSFKEKNYKAKFLTSSIIKKMKSTKIILKNKNKKKMKEKENTCVEWKKNEKKNMWGMEKK